MNLSSMYGRRAAMPPCKTFIEMAEELGMSQQKLLGHMRGSAIPFPAPELKTGAPKHRMWYSPAKVRAWWKARQHEIAMSELRSPRAAGSGDTTVPGSDLPNPQMHVVPVEFHNH